MESRPPIPFGTAAGSLSLRSSGSHDDPPIGPAVRIARPTGAPRPRVEAGHRRPRRTRRARPGGSLGLPIWRRDERAGPRVRTRGGGPSPGGIPTGDLGKWKRGRSRGEGSRPARARDPRPNRGELVPPDGTAHEENRPDPRDSRGAKRPRPAPERADSGHRIDASGMPSRREFG